MNKFYLTLIIILLFNYKAYCQNLSKKNVSGSVLDEKTQEKLEYVNIGILNKNFGTISDPNGHFQLAIPDSLINDTLTFSYVGYRTLQIPIRKLVGSTNVEIIMNSIHLNIDEINIYAKEPKVKKYGVRSHSPLGFMPAYIDRDIYEIAFLVEPKKKPVKIKNLNIYIHHSRIDTCTFRINIYNFKDGIPFEKLNTENIITVIPIKSGQWNKIDLSEYNLVFNSVFFVSVEFIPDFIGKRPYQISYGFKMIKNGKSYIRQYSQGKWSIVKYNTSFNIDVLE